MDLVDDIHERSSDKISKGIPLLSDNLSKWVKRNESPCDMDILLRLSLIDARRKEAH